MAETFDAFISYRSTDRALAEDLTQRLTAAGFSVWFDVEALDRVGRWHQDIEAGCEASRVVLPVLTPDWESQWTQYETYGGEAVVPLVCKGEGPVDKLVPPALSEWQALDLRQATAATWETLFTRLREYLAQPAPEKRARTANLPFSANPYFVGREALLLEIHAKLCTTPTSALTHDPAFVLEGLGGIGKTTLARQYAEKFWRLYRDLLWVPAGNPDLLPLEFARLAVQMGLLPEQSDNPTRDAERALRELEQGPRRLLILDNAEDEDSVRAWLPKVGKCHTLLTSRFTHWSAEVQTVTVHVLERDPARELLLRRSGLPHTEANCAAADELAKDLGYLPLALEQAAAYISQQHLSLEAYRERFAQYRARLLDRRQPGGTDYPNSVATAWQITVEKLTPPAQAVLRLLPFMASDPLPRSVLTGAGDLLGVALEQDPLDELEVEEALGELQGYSLIGLEDAGGPLTIHRLLQAVQEDGLPAEEQAAWTERALRVIERAFPVPDHANWQVCEPLVPHAMAASGHGERRRLVSGGVGLLPAQVGEFYQLRGEMSASLAPGEQAVKAFERLAAADPGNAAWQAALTASRASLGVVLANLGDTTGARQALETSLAMGGGLEAGSPREPLWKGLLTDFRAMLGQVLQAQGDTAGAERMDEPSEAPAGEQADERRRLAERRGRLGDKRLSRGDLSGALREYEASHAIFERLAAAGSELEGLAASHDRLGDVWMAQGDLARALRAYEASLAIRERLNAADPGNAAWQRGLSVSRNKLGDLRMAQGDVHGAQREYEADLVIAERLAEMDPANAVFQRDLSISRERLGDVQLSQGDFCGALRAYEMSLAVRERLTASDPHNAQWRRGLAVSYYKLGDIADKAQRPEDALRHYRRCRETLQGMKARGVHLDVQAAQVLEWLDELLG